MSIAYTQAIVGKGTLLEQLYLRLKSLPRR